MCRGCHGQDNYIEMEMSWRCSKAKLYKMDQTNNTLVTMSIQKETKITMKIVRWHNKENMKKSGITFHKTQYSGNIPPYLL